MVVIGLTGGIGSGKSTVSAGLAGRGATLIDADAIVHQLQQPGTKVLAEMVERFGEDILHPDGSLNRPAMAQRVFGAGDDSDGSSDEGDSEKRAVAIADLNAIVHPAVGREIRERLIAAYADAQTELVVLDIPLLAEGLVKGEKPRYATSGVLVIDTSAEVALERVVASRSMSVEDVQARMDAQLSRSERIGIADFVISNVGNEDELEVQIEAAYRWALGLTPTESPTSPSLS